MVNIGNILGGVAGERGRREERERKSRVVDLQARQVGLGERQFEFGQEQAETAQRTAAGETKLESINQSIDLLGEAINAPGQDPNIIQRLAEGIEGSIAIASDTGLIDPGIINDTRLRLQSIVGGPTAVEAATGRGEIAATETTAGLETLLGREPTEEERLRKAGVAPPPPPASPAIRKLLDDKARVDTDLASAVQTGNIAEAERLKFESNALDGAIKQAQLENVSPELVTTGTRGEAESMALASAGALEAVGSLSTLLQDNPDQFGFTGATKEIINKTLAQGFPSLFSPDRAVAEAAVETIRLDLQRAISKDARFTENDRKFIFALFPSTGFFETQAEAEIKVKTLMALFARRLVAASEVPGVELPVELSNFTLEDVGDAVRQGILPKAEGAKIAKVLFADELRAAVGEQ